MASLRMSSMVIVNWPSFYEQGAKMKIKNLLLLVIVLGRNNI